MQAMKELKRGGSNGSSGSVTGEETAGEGDDRWVPPVGEGKRIGWVTVWFFFLGCGLVSYLGRIGS
jgi:hypothetical protein